MRCAGIAMFSGLLWALGASAQSQAVGPVGQTAPVPLIRAEKRLVLVDAVVTGRRGKYIRGLTAKDFRLWEDKKEQKIESFASEADTASPRNDRKHYLVLFFDNSTMSFGEQAYARQAALKFVATNAGVDRLVAAVDYGGSLSIAQNFTENSERLKAVIGGAKFAYVSAEPGGAAAAQLSVAAADFGARDLLLAVRTLAKNLAVVPGRKILVLLSSGFPLNSFLRTEVPATIDACNKANLAIYAIDARGLVTNAPPISRLNVPWVTGNAQIVPAVLRAGDSAAYLVTAYAQQRGGARAGSVTSGGTNSAGVGAGLAPAPGTVRMPGNPLPNMRPPILMSPIPPGAAANQEVMYALATGTGGFVIANTNDLLGGLEKIGQEQNEYYVLGYSPDDSPPGSCHTIKVKVERAGANVRSRSGYCNAKPVDALAGTPVEKILESRIAGTDTGNVKASMQSPFFYTSPNTARVKVAVDIPAGSLRFTRENGRLHATVNVLGVAYKPDGGIAARFSDGANIDLRDEKEVRTFQGQPYHYETQFDIAPGVYTLKVVFAGGKESFGKVQSQLAIDTYNGKQFAMSSLVVSDTLRVVGDAAENAEVALLEDETPLISKGIEITPEASCQFKTKEPVVLYFEIYDPSLAGATPPQVGIDLRVINRKTGQQELDTGLLGVASFERAGNPVIPVGLKLPLDSLAAGVYRLELKALDTAGHTPITRSADFELN